MTVELPYNVFYNKFIAIFARYGGKMMEQLNLSMANDTEKVYKILGELIHMDREFQIMITVPSGSKTV